MTRYVVQRLLAMIPTFFGILCITFFIVKLAPGNPVALRLHAAQNAARAGGLSAEASDEMLKLYGLKVDLPAWYARFIDRTASWVHGSDSPQTHTFTRRALVWLGENSIQFKIWVVQVLNLEFGRSFKDQRPVIDKIKEALPVTLGLNCIELLIVYFISIPLGVFSALHRESKLDKAVMVLLFILYSLPNFWVAYLLILYFAGDAHFNWFPLRGLLSDEAANFSAWQKIVDVLWHLVLPVTAMVYASFAFLTRFSRSTMLEVIRQDFIRTARAKGLRPRQVIWRHAFRNQLIPLITLMGTLLPALLGGSVIIEHIFSIPGMGRLAFESVLARDYPTVMAIATLSALLTLIGLLLSDIAYVWADPRISFEGRQHATK